MDPYAFRARVTGVLVEQGRILLVKHQQPIAQGRYWSLPGGKVEAGETLEQAMKREMREETGLSVEIDRLLYVCDNQEAQGLRVHFLFRLTRTDGELTMPSNLYDENHIHELRFVPLEQLTDLNFSDSFRQRALNDFPDAGHYKGHKRNIGL